MDPQDRESRSKHKIVEHDTETRWAHKNPGGLWLLALAAIPLVLAALGSVVKADAIETGLKVESLAALKAQGMDGLNVSFDGRDATVSLPAGSTMSGEDLEHARALVAGVRGVRVADADVASAETGETATGNEEATEAPSEAATEAASETPSAEASQEPSEEATPVADACAVDTITTQIADVLGADKIQFGEKSAKLDAAAADEVSKVAALLAACPDLAITASGHTDNLGAAGTLSARRGTTVAKALVKAGIARSSITSVGARDADPLGDNATQEGRDMNRYADIAVK